jgi:hypothetical protein
VRTAKAIFPLFPDPSQKTSHNILIQPKRKVIYRFLSVSLRVKPLKRVVRPVDPERTVSATTVNRALACLRRLLRLAQEWRVIDRVPKIHSLSGEYNREFILNHEQEVHYLETVDSDDGDG